MSQPTGPDIIDVTFTSVWDGGHEVETDARLDATSGRLLSIDAVDVGDEVTTLDRQYVTLPDGRDLDVIEDDAGHGVADPSEILDPPHAMRP